MGRKKNRLPENQSEILCYFQPRTQKQEDLYKSIRNNEVVVGIGPAGTGKSYVALNAALKLLEEGYKNIYLCKSVTTLPGEEIGFIKGGIEDKMASHMMSFTWNIDKALGKKNASKNLMDKGIIEVLPLAFIRGLSIDDSIVIIDEAQNLTYHTFKSIMTRIGENSKYIFLGDVEQIDRKKKQESCLSGVFELFEDEDYIGTVKFEDKDCVRNPIIPKILSKLKEKEID